MISYFQHATSMTDKRAKKHGLRRVPIHIILYSRIESHYHGVFYVRVIYNAAEYSTLHRPLLSPLSAFLPDVTEAEQSHLHPSPDANPCLFPGPSQRSKSVKGRNSTQNAPKNKGIKEIPSCRRTPENNANIPGPIPRPGKSWHPTNLTSTYSIIHSLEQFLLEALPLQKPRFETPQADTA